MIRSLLRIVLVAGLVSALGLAIAARLITKRDAEVRPYATPLPTRWSYATEQEWIVAQVVKALANMAQYARGGAVPASGQEVLVATETDPTGQTVFTVRMPGGDGRTARLAVTEYIWSPSLYAPLATELLGPAGTAPATAAALESETFRALTSPRTEVMVAESERVSAVLAAHMTDAAAHEDAALLYAAMGLREHSGWFYDNHWTLSRLAAHLAMAAALRKGGDPGPSGRVAELTLLTLAFRDQAGVLGGLDALDRQPDGSAAARAWSRALRMRNTEDWRLLAEPDKASLLERFEYVSWVNTKLGHGHAMAFLERAENEELPDWGSIILSASYSVEAANRFVPEGMGAVLADIRSMPLGLGDEPDPAALARALNEEPAPGPVRPRAGRTVVEVLDAGTWAAFAQRHLLHHVENGVYAIRHMWGERARGDQYAVQMAKSFGALRQFPLAARRMAENGTSYANAMRGSLELLARGPEWIGGHNWNFLLKRPDFTADVFPVPEVESWYRPLFPAGTYFEWPKRLWLPNGYLRVRGALLQQMHETLPYYGVLAEAEASDRLGHNPAAADLKRAFGPSLDYDVRLMARLAEASKDDPAEYKALYRRIGALDPDRIRTLGEYLAQRGEKAEAAAAYEEYVSRARDRVRVCNSVRWLVNYYEDAKKAERALAIAKEAAEVYCQAGLVTLADLYERRNQWPNAEEYFRRAAERYDDERLLLGFYLRHQRATHDERYSRKRQALLGRFFPEGLQTAAQEATAAPTDGVVLMGTSPETNKAALKAGDIIVALDGFRVHDYDQYRVVRSLSKAPEFKLTVWRSQYIHVMVSQPDRWLGVEATSYNGPPGRGKNYL